MGVGVYAHIDPAFFFLQSCSGLVAGLPPGAGLFHRPPPTTTKTDAMHVRLD